MKKQLNANNCIFLLMKMLNYNLKSARNSYNIILDQQKREEEFQISFQNQLCFPFKLIQWNGKLKELFKILLN